MSVRLFVGNLPYETSEAELREHFSSVGPLRQVFLPVDRETGRPRGFAFVEFDDPAHAQAAIDRLNQQPFKGRTLAINEARARESRPPGADGPSYRPRPSGPPPSFGGGGGPSGGFGRSGGTLGGADGSRREGRPARRRTGDRRTQNYDKPKGPIRERLTGQLFTTEDTDDPGGPEPEIDNFATRAHDDDPEPANRELDDRDDE
jgi:RNA recognition motif-containing protein